MAVPERSIFLPALVLEIKPLVLASNVKNSERNIYPFSISTIRNYLIARARTNLASGAAFGVGEYSVVWESVGDRPKKALKEDPVALSSGFLVDNKPLLQDRLQIEQTPIPIFGLPTDDPSQCYNVPCIIQVFVSTEMKLEEQNPTVSITLETILQLLPPVSPPPINAADATSSKGMTELMSLLVSSHSKKQEYKLRTQAENDAGSFHVECVQSSVSRQELKHRIASQISRSVGVGTSRSTAKVVFKSEKRFIDVKRSLMQYCRERRVAVLPKQDSSSGICDLTFSGPKAHIQKWQPSLLLTRGNERGTVEWIKKTAEQTGCSMVHVLEPVNVLACGGARSDSALHCTLHALVLQAALRGEALCLVLDNLQSIMPSLPGVHSSDGDAAAPVLRSIASSIRLISQALWKNNFFQFPSDFQYHEGWMATESGYKLRAKLCILGVVNSPRIECRLEIEHLSQANRTDIDIMPYQFRLAPLEVDAKVRIVTGVLGPKHPLTDEAMTKLKELAVGAPWLNRRACLALGKLLKEMSSGRVLKVFPVDIAVAFTELVQTRVSNPSGYAFTNWKKGGSNFEAVGGLKVVKRVTLDAMERGGSKQLAIRQLGMSPQTAILLYGPPGCGKTLWARSIASLVQVTDNQTVNGSFISIGSGDLMKSDIGTGERILVSMFQYARKRSPCVIFLDEFEALFVGRQRAGSGKLTTTLLQCLDDLALEQGRHKNAYSPGTVAIRPNHVFVMAATNRPWMVDPSFLRPGRFDRVVYISLPGRLERQTIVKLHIDRMYTSIDTASLENLAAHIAVATRGWSGADLAGLCKRAACHAILDNFAKCSLKVDHFQSSLTRGFTSAVDLTIVERCEKWQN